MKIINIIGLAIALFFIYFIHFKEVNEYKQAVEELKIINQNSIDQLTDIIQEKNASIENLNQQVQKLQDLNAIIYSLNSSGLEITSIDQVNDILSLASKDIEMVSPVVILPFRLKEMISGGSLSDIVRETFSDSTEFNTPSKALILY